MIRDVNPELSSTHQMLQTPVPWLVPFLAVVLGSVFFLNEVDWQASLHEHYAVLADQAEAQVEAGSTARKIGYTVIGLLGALMCLWPSRQSVRFLSIPAALIGLYWLTCVASVTWSADPALSAKRVVVLTFCLVGIIGVVKHLGPPALLNLTLAIATMLVIIGFCTELALGTFRPLRGDYRFAGTVHPNTAGAYCAVMVIAAFFKAKSVDRRKWLYAALFCTALVLLLLTKSRNSLGGCLVGLSAAWFLGTSRAAKTLVAVAAPFAVCSILIAALLFGVELTSQLDSAVRLGREGLESGFASLNGRVPLWIYLTDLMAERPLLGYGYHGFWTPVRIFEVSLDQGWTVPTAHSSYIDLVLSVGLFGATFLALPVLLALARLIRRCAASGDPVQCYLLSVMLLALTTGLLESGFAQPTSFVSFFIACGLCSVLAQPDGSALPARDMARATVPSLVAEGQV